VCVWVCGCVCVCVYLYIYIHIHILWQESDVYEHMERDLRSKSARIAELQRDLAETKAKLDDTQRARDTFFNKQVFTSLEITS
jgi:hypothetical protein